MRLAMHYFEIMPEIDVCKTHTRRKIMSLFIRPLVVNLRPQGQGRRKTSSRNVNKSLGAALGFCVRSPSGSLVSYELNPKIFFVPACPGWGGEKVTE